jgi:REP element-mobilizing transposase RayT
MSDRFEVDVCAYVLMDNHYHLLLRTNRSNLSKSLQWFGATYTKRFYIRCSRITFRPEPRTGSWKACCSEVNLTMPKFYGNGSVIWASGLQS